MIKEVLKQALVKEDKKPKTSFWPTDAEKLNFDIFHTWMGTPPTNPMESEKLLMFEVAKLMEVALLETLAKAGKIKDQQVRIEYERMGVPITGYADAVTEDGKVIEVKTFYGDYQAKELKQGKPKTAYIKQIACYMDALDLKEGILVYVDRGTGDMYEFPVRRLTDNTYICGVEVINLDLVYQRWAKLYHENILPKIEPECEYRYKIPVSELNFKALSKAQVSAIRGNKKVIGDHPWMIQYSPYKSLIIEREETEPGYSLKEIEYILLNT